MMPNQAAAAIPLLETVRAPRPMSDSRPPQNKRAQSEPGITEASGEIVPKKPSTIPPPLPSLAKGSQPPTARKASAVEVPQHTDEITQPGLEMKASNIARVVGGEIDPYKK
jgi:hypothetical protein